MENLKALLEQHTQYQGDLELAQAFGVTVETLQALRTKEAIFDNQFELGLALPRWLYWQYQLEHGTELTEQQLETHAKDLENMEAFATRLLLGTPPDVNGAIYSVDILNPICNAFGYFIGSAQKVRPTHEEHLEIWKRELDWARQTEAVARINEILSLGASDEEKEVGARYLNDRNDGHSILATVTRTMMLDWIHVDYNNMESEGFKQDFETAKQVFASMDRINDNWQDAFYGGLVSEIYMFYGVQHFRETDPKEVNQAAWNIVQQLSAPAAAAVEN